MCVLWCGCRDARRALLAILSTLSHPPTPHTTPHTTHSQVFKSQQAAADDFFLDAPLSRACAADKSRYCREVEPHEGAVQECLRGEEGRLEWGCKTELFRCVRVCVCVCLEGGRAGGAGARGPEQRGST